jgi:hypothetical protein
MKTTTILCLAALLGLAACDHHDDAATQAPSAAASDNSAFLEAGLHAAASEPAAAPSAPAGPAPHVDRGPPPVVPPIVRDGIRYAQGEQEHDAGLAQASGMLVVSDDFSGKRLWTLAVYSEGADAKKEADARWIFFKSMAFDAQGWLHVVNEADREFVVDVKRHTTTAVAP